MDRRPRTSTLNIFILLHEHKLVISQCGLVLDLVFPAYTVILLRRNADSTLKRRSWLNLVNKNSKLKKRGLQ